MAKEISPTERYYKRLKMLESERKSWEGHWQDLSSYILPRTARFLSGDTTPNDGAKKNDKVIDGTATRAVKILAAGMQGGLTSPARPWFRLSTPDKTLMEKAKSVRVWLETCRDLMLDVFSKSNFYNVIHSLYQELAVYGTAAMLVEEDYENVIRCKAYTIGEYYLALDPLFRVDTFYRVFHATAGQLVGKFGIKNCSDPVAKLVEDGNQDTWVKVVHLIEPRETAVQEYYLKPKNKKPWRSVYYEWGKARGDKILGEGGYEEFPILAPRWDVVGSDIYGSSPGMDALGDIKMLQAMQEDSINASYKMNNPVMNAGPGMKGEPHTLAGGEVNYVKDVQNGFAPAYQVNFDIQKAEFKIERVQRAIREYFFNDLFLMLAGETKTMTATEVSERHEEKLLMIGPVLERLQSECLNPLIDRTFNIMHRAGILPPPPPEMQGQELKVEYISLLAQAQKLVGVTGIERLSTFAGNLLQGGFTEIRHKFNASEAIDQYADFIGVPTSIIKSDEEANAADEAEKRMAQAQQAVETGGQMADAAKKLSETRVGETEQTMLDRMLGGPRQ